MTKFFKNRTVIGLICIILSLIICFGLTPLFNDALQAKTEVVKVIKDIFKGEVITDKHIKVVEVGGYNLPDNVVKIKEDIIGKYAAADLYKNDFILDTKVINKPITDNSYLYDFDGSKRAVSITIKSFAAGLSGKLERNDIVSIIAVDHGEQRETYVPAELQYVRVLAVTTSQGLDKQSEYTNGDREEELPSTITLIVSPMQARLLAELEEKSKIHIALVYRGIEKLTQEFLDQQEEITNEISEVSQNYQSDSSLIGETDNPEMETEGVSTNEE